MSTIAFVALHTKMLEQARDVLKVHHPDVRLAKGLMGEAVGVVRKLAADGVEVVISRGATAKIIEGALPDISVVDISSGGMDLIKALYEATHKTDRIAVVAFPYMTGGVKEMGRMFGVDIGVYELFREEDIGPQIIKARDEGAAIVVGGFIMAQVAKELGVPCQPVETGPRSILSAVEEARRIAHARAVEKTKSSLMRAVLTSTDNGIVAVDRDGTVTVFNPMAGRMLRLTEADALGRPIADVWPRLGLDKVLDTGKGDAGQIERVFDQEIMCNKAAITVRGVTVGAVATFHDVRQIQKMEATVRKSILASGHVATVRFKDILGTSEILRQAISMGIDFAQYDATVLVRGETGTGKELFAQSIHNASDRSAGPFVAVNCAALPGQLLESELFGYVQGAFTGASQKGKPGLFELAHGGTIFLDEIAEMDAGIQGKLLRVLQEKKVMRLGSDQVIPVDVRVVAATNRSLTELVHSGAFRSDLYYRLNVLRLKLPPLRQRLQDIPILAEHFLAMAQTRGQGHVLSAAALQELKRHAWPGNVRELQNVMARVAAMLKEGEISGSLIRQLLEDSPVSPVLCSMPNEGEQIGQALAETRGRVGEAAKLLGVSRSTLWRRMRRLGPV
ncbi:MAG: sigma 54-interacting transcriptional regulator [Desulfovibrio sp.]|nr:sigma 54-interacting transcriptional regulator [Desulfovibrio sp.]MBI4957879.1 sigma 54-interacting transcriptional regulator [Desulfovibrio sp.]